jgi:tRNA(adenine34) deaminase
LTIAVFQAEDRVWMQRALQQAQAAFEVGDYPVGAVLTVDGALFATARNSLFSDGRTTAHAEHNLIAAHSAELRMLIRTRPDTQTCLYTTLEPCLMCLGIAVLHRISRIVVACPDPNGGTTRLDISMLGSVYRRWWPAVEIGLYREESCRLIEQFLITEKFLMWESMLQEFQHMRQQWVVSEPPA